MIGKVIIGKSFRGCIGYCLEDKLSKSQEIIYKKDRAEILLFNQCFGNSKELSRQFNEVRQLNAKLSKPVLHLILSMAKDEKVDKNILQNIAEECAKHFSFSNNQFIAVNHNDTGNQHIHIVANRIGFDKKTLSDSNSYKVMAAFCRKMEQQYNLQQVLSPRKFLSRELRKIPRADARKEAIKNDLKIALLSSKNFNEFELRMKEKKYQVIKGRGIAFVDNKGVYVKGSELGYSLAAIEKILLQPEHRKQLAFEEQPQKENHSRRQSQIHFQQKEKHISLSPAKEQEIKASLILNDLINPIAENSNTPNELLKKKKRKKMSQHL
jgi:hypothetical protein